MSVTIAGSFLESPRVNGRKDDSSEKVNGGVREAKGLSRHLPARDVVVDETLR